MLMLFRGALPVEALTGGFVPYDIDLLCSLQVSQGAVHGAQSHKRPGMREARMQSLGR